MNIVEERLCVFINFRSVGFFSTINLSRKFLTTIVSTQRMSVLKEGIHKFLILMKKSVLEMYAISFSERQTT